MKYALLVLFLLMTSPAVSQPLVKVDQSGDDTIDIQADALVAAPVAVVWGTLTDYEHLANFIPDMHSSSIVSAPDAPLLVKQEGAASFLGYHFPINVTLEIDAAPPDRVRFRSISGNVRDMEGSYLLEGMGAATHLHYEAHLRPDFWVPALIGTAVMQGEITRQFEGLIAEILRRSESHEHTVTPAR